MGGCGTQRGPGELGADATVLAVPDPADKVVHIFGSL